MCTGETEGDAGGLNRNTNQGSGGGSGHVPRGAKGAATTGAWAVTDEATGLDDLDVRLLEVLRQHPRLGMVEVARRLQVARATAQARLQRLVERGVVSGFGPDVDLVAAGYPVAAFSTLEIAQGRCKRSLRTSRLFPQSWRPARRRAAPTSGAASRPRAWLSFRRRCCS